MKIKNEKTKLIIWALVALVIGVIIGMIITNATTGNAMKNIDSGNIIYIKKDITPYEEFALKNISDYIKENNIDLVNNFVIRPSTEGKLKKIDLEVYDSGKYSIVNDLGEYYIVNEYDERVNYVGGCGMYRHRWPLYDYTVTPPVLLGYYTTTGHVTGDGPNIANIVTTFDME